MWIVNGYVLWLVNKDEYVGSKVAILQKTEDRVWTVLFQKCRKGCQGCYQLEKGSGKTIRMFIAKEVLFHLDL